MKLHRREFTRTAATGLFALAARPLLSREPECDPTCEPDAVAAPRVALTWGANGHGDGQFDYPIAVVVNAADEVLVTDFRQSKANPQARLQRFDPEGRFLATFDLDPMPGGLAIDRDGLLFVTHMMQHRVAVYEQSGKFVREFGKQGSAPGELQQPGGIAFGPDGSLFVADQVNHRIQQLTPQGEPIRQWGKYGTATGEFGGNSSVNSRTGGPHFLAFNSEGNLYTTEGTVGRIQKFKPDGTFLLAFGDNDDGPGHFGGGHALEGPIGIAVDARDNLWITSTNHRVQQFTPDGKYVRGLGGEGSEPGQFVLPHGLAFDRARQHLYVCDARNSRIQKLAI